MKLMITTHVYENYACRKHNSLDTGVNSNLKRDA